MVCPSASLDAASLAKAERGAEQLEAAGCRVRFDVGHAQRRWRGYYAGDDQARLDAFVAACTEPGVDAVWWARGGGGAGRIAGAAIAALRGVAPRVVVGFSDATALLAALGSLGWLVFHGPVLSSFGRAKVPEMLAILRGDTQEVRFAPGSGPSVTGVLRGGNLMTLASLVGRPWCPAGADAIWLLEEVDEDDRRVDRCLEQLREAGCFGRSQAVWAGPLYRSLQVDRTAEEAGLPVITGAPAGHEGPMALLPLGARVTLDARAGRLVGLHPWVERLHG